MNFFRLRDDKAIPKRWHLGFITCADGTEPQLLDGVVIDSCHKLVAPITHPGRALDFSLTSFAVPVATLSLSSAIKDAAGCDLQVIPLGLPVTEDMAILNVLRTIACVDESRSEFIKWTLQDHRADLAGQYRQVTKLAINKDVIPLDANIFRISGWPVALVVSEKMRSVMIHAGCEGAKFEELT